MKCPVKWPVIGYSRKRADTGENVEPLIGNDGVSSSILLGGTIIPVLHLCAPCELSRTVSRFACSTEG